MEQLFLLWLSLLIREFTGLDIALGRVMVIGSVFSSLFYPVLLWIFEQIPALAELCNDPLLASITGLDQRSGQSIMTVFKRKYLNKVQKVIHDTDPNAFFTAEDVKKVHGRGFTLERYTRDLKEVQ